MSPPLPPPPPYWPQAPKDKLVCILNCCRVVNSMLAARIKADGIGEPGAQRTQRMPGGGAVDGALLWSPGMPCDSSQQSLTGMAAE
jgi:hypothetical protein